jgi:hypothetical protein
LSGWQIHTAAGSITMNQVIFLTEIEMEHKLNEYIELFDILYDEAYYWWENLKEDHYSNLFMRRAAVRATFAFIEGVIYSLKPLLLSLEKIKNYLELEEIVILREKKYEPDNSGRTSSSPARYEFKKNVLFTIRCFAKYMKIEMPLNMEATEWSDFLKAIKIRHRLMHPKKPDDLNINHEELMTVNRAFIWFYNGLGSCWGGRHPSKSK